MYNLINQALMNITLQHELDTFHDEDLRFMQQAVKDFQEQIDQHYMKQQNFVKLGILDKTTFSPEEKEKFDKQFKEIEDWISNLRAEIKGK